MSYDDYDPDDEDWDDDREEDWQEGECDRCFGGDEGGVTALGPLGPVFCACFIGMGASQEDCYCGPEDD